MSLLTAKQTQILSFIRRQIQLTGQSPTVREIGIEVGLSSSCSVQKHIDTLERHDKIRRNGSKFRSIELVDDDGELTRLRTNPFLVPLLGSVAGGLPREAIEYEDCELLPIPPTLVSRADRDHQSAACSAGEFHEAPYFALEVTGESMQGAGISDGDWVIAHRQKVAHDGDIVIALVDKTDATVKRYFHEGKAIRLQPENPAFQPLITTNVEILGRVTLSIKRF